MIKQESKIIRADPLLKLDHPRLSASTKSAFSLLELLIYMALLSVVMLAVGGIFVGINAGRSKAEVQAEVNSNLQFAIQQISNDLRGATAVSAPSSVGGGGGGGAVSSSVLTITTPSSTIIYCVASSTLRRATYALSGVDSWINGTALPAVRYAHSSAVNNGYIYATGGVYTAGGAVTSSVVYSPINSTGSLGSWVTASALPAARYYHATIANNGYIYAIGGKDNVVGPTSSVVYASINSTGSLGSWTAATALPAVKGELTSIVNNGYVYAIGGVDSGSNSTSSVFYASINSTGSLGSWTAASALPAGRYGHSSFVNNGYVYAIGGVSSGASTSSVIYALINATGSLGSWATATALPAHRFYHASIVNNGYIYVMGGLDGAAVATSSVVYVPINATGSLGSWVTATALPAARQVHSSIMNNGYIYTMGGLDSGGSLLSSTVYTPITCAGDAITANTVNVTGFTLTKLENTNSVLSKTATSIQADITVSYNATAPEQQYSERKVTTVSLRN